MPVTHAPSSGSASPARSLIRVPSRHHEDGRLCRAIYPARRTSSWRRLRCANGPRYLLIAVYQWRLGRPAACRRDRDVTLTLSTLGLPLAGVGLLLAIDPILDMGRTATNVAGQALVPTLVAAREGTLDRGAYDAAGRRDITEPAETDQRPVDNLAPVPA